MGENILTNNKPHGGAGVTKHKHRKHRLKVREDIGKMPPPSLALGERHLLEVTFWRTCNATKRTRDDEQNKFEAVEHTTTTWRDSH